MYKLNKHNKLFLSFFWGSIFIITGTISIFIPGAASEIANRESISPHMTDTLNCNYQYDFTLSGNVNTDPYAMPKQKTMRLDENGVIENYAYTINQFVKNPFTIVIYGMSGINTYCMNQDKEGLQIAIKQADWLIENIEEKNGFSGWYYQEPSLGLEKGWTSALSNSSALAFLAHVYLITTDKKYIEKDEKILNGFEIDVKNGGLKKEYFDGSIFFEEYPGSTKISSVLNGHLITLRSLEKYDELMSSTKARDLLHKGLRAVSNHLMLYDARFSTYYAQGINGYPKPFRQPDHYAHITHTEGLEWLASIAEGKNKERFHKVAEHWRSYTEKYFKRKNESGGFIINPSFLMGPLHWNFNAATYNFDNGWGRIDHENKEESIKQTTNKGANKGDSLDLLFEARYLGADIQNIKARIYGMKNTKIKPKWDGSFECKFDISSSNNWSHFLVSGAAIKDWDLVGIDFRISQKTENPTFQIRNVKLINNGEKYKNKNIKCLLNNQSSERNILIKVYYYIKNWWTSDN